MLIMAKDYKYPDSTPVDEPVRKVTKAEGYAKPPKAELMRRPPEGLAKPPSSDTETSKTNAMGDTYAKGGMTASARADGCCTKGKTRGKMY